MKKIKPKEKVDKTNLFIRNVTKETKLKFQAKAKALGYLPREYFDLLVKGL
jgi:hypothetical protein